MEKAMGNSFSKRGLSARMPLLLLSLAALALPGSGCVVAPPVSTKQILRQQALLDFTGLLPAQMLEKLNVKWAVPRDWEPLPPRTGLMFFSATAFWPFWLPPLSPMKITFLKPCACRLSAASVSTARNVSSRIVIVPGDAMWPVLGSMPPSGTSLMIGAHRAFPILRAMASQLACST